MSIPWLGLKVTVRIRVRARARVRARIRYGGMALLSFSSNRPYTNHDSRHPNRSVP